MQLWDCCRRELRLEAWLSGSLIPQRWIRSKVQSFVSSNGIQVRPEPNTLPGSFPISLTIFVVLLESLSTGWLAWVQSTGVFVRTLCI